jgi:TolA-binding protein
MTGNKVKWHRWGGTLVAAGLAMGMMPQAAQAQNADDRLARIETQLRALQRQVFPGGDQRFFEPEITANPATPTPGPAADGASTSALTGVLSRLEAIELQLARLTAATEVNENSLMLLEARVLAMETSAAAAAAPPPFVTTTPTPGPTGVIGTPTPTPGPAPAATPAPASGPTAERLAAVQAILKPATEDAGDDEYTYGFRLWEAGFYPEARQQLRSFVDRYPSHWRMSYGRNLLGRAYLDDNAPREAASWFLQNYQTDKQGVRAPDSLLYLAESMIASGDTNRACIALSEFGETYPALASGRLASEYESNRAKVDCD